MYPFGPKNSRGYISPVSLAVLGFLIVSFLVGSIAVVRQSFDIRQRAAGLYANGTACVNNSQCGSGLCACPAGTGLNCVPEDKVCQAVPLPTNACISNGQIVGQGATCCTGASHTEGNNVVCGPAPAVCPLSCKEGCITNASGFACVPFCDITCAGDETCYKTSAGGACVKNDCPVSGYQCKTYTQGQYRVYCPAAGATPLQQEHCPSGCTNGICNAPTCDTQKCVNGCNSDGSCKPKTCEQVKDLYECGYTPGCIWQGICISKPVQSIPLELPPAQTGRYVSSCDLTDLCKDQQGCKCYDICIKESAAKGESCGGYKGANGETCINPSLCESGYCQKDLDNTLVCAAKPCNKITEKNECKKPANQCFWDGSLCTTLKNITIKENCDATSYLIPLQRLDGGIENAQLCKKNDSIFASCIYGAALVGSSQSYRCLAESEKISGLSQCTKTAGDGRFTEDDLGNSLNTRTCQIDGIKYWECQYRYSRAQGKISCLTETESKQNLDQCPSYQYTYFIKESLSSLDYAVLCAHPNSGDAVWYCQYGFVQSGGLNRCIGPNEKGYYKLSTSCFDCTAGKVCPYKTLDECLSQGQGSCLPDNCAPAGKSCTQFGLETDANNRCSDSNVECCIAKTQGYDLIGGICRICRENCRFNSEASCQKELQTEKIVPNGVYCSYVSETGETLYIPAGNNSYRYYQNDPDWGYVCKEATCYGNQGRITEKFCDQKSINSDPSTVNKQLNPQESANLKQGQQIEKKYQNQNISIDYMDIPSTQNLSTLDTVLSRVPPSMYKDRKFNFYDNSRAPTIGGEVRPDDNPNQVNIGSTESDDTHRTATVILHELAHTHENQTYASSSCDQNKPTCTLVEVYDTARVKDNICVGDELDATNNSCANNSFEYGDTQHYGGHAPSNEELAHAVAAYCTDGAKLKAEQPHVYNALKETIYEGQSCDVGFPAPADNNRG